jgi:hypothetical protein
VGSYTDVMARTHPHIESPDADQLAELVAGRPEPLIEAYLELHAAVISTLPDIRFSVDTVDASVGYAAHQYGYNGWGMAALTPFAKWVSLTLLRGARLDDPARLLSGRSTMRHLKVTGPEDARNGGEAIRALLLEASGLNAED